MTNRHLILAAVVVGLCLGTVAAAQDQPARIIAESAVQSAAGETTLSGNVVLTVNGVVMRADRAVVKGSEVTLEGNVRVTLPKPVYTAEEMRKRIPVVRAPVPVVPNRSGPLLIDPPMPKPWEPPQR